MTLSPGTRLGRYEIRSLLGVTADGQRFLINSNVAGAQSSPFTVMINWTTGLKR